MAEIIFSPGSVAAAYSRFETADTRRGDVEDDAGFEGDESGG